MRKNEIDHEDPPRLREAFAAAQDLQSFTRALGLLLAQGPLKHAQWELVDHVARAMARMRELLQHEPTRLVMEADHDGIAQLLPLLSDASLEQLLAQLLRDKPQAPRDPTQDWYPTNDGRDQAGAVH